MKHHPTVIKVTILILTGKPSGRRPRGRLRRTRLEQIVKKIVVNTKNYNDSANNRDYWRVLANAALKLRVP